MSRLKMISPELAVGEASNLLDSVHAKMGMVPNMTRAMVNAPSVLDGYLNFSHSVSHGKLSAKVREQLALTVAQVNECDYCLAAHTAVGRMVGLTADQIRDSRLGTAVDANTDTLIRFARKVVEARGRISESDLEEMRAAGFDDGSIAEVIANVALNIFTNYFNNVAETDIDFPVAARLKSEPVASV